MGGTIVEKLVSKDVIHPPRWLPDNTCYLTMMGSVAYGTNLDTSDIDVYGICIPPKDHVFPHLAGEILGFGRQLKRFEQWQEHHIQHPDEKDKTYDFQVTGIVKFFNLLMENNPNVVDSVYTPQFCVMHMSKIGEMIRSRRDMFLHKGAWHKFKGYAFSQLHKMSTKDPEPGSKREALREKFGFDVKFGCHVVRLLLECEMILEEGTIDIQKHREHLKAIRRGEVPEEEIRAWFTNKEKHLESLYQTSKLRHSPDEVAIKMFLLECLEHHFGNLEKAITMPGAAEEKLARIRAILD